MRECEERGGATELLSLDWSIAHRIIERAVERVMARREEQTIPDFAIDEKSFGYGHSYVSTMTDMKESRALEVVEDRTEEAANRLWNCPFFEAKRAG